MYTQKKKVCRGDKQDALVKYMCEPHNTKGDAQFWGGIERKTSDGIYSVMSRVGPTR